MSDPLTFPYFEVEGDAEAIGLDYGRKAAGRLGVSLDIYRPVFEAAGMTWDAAIARAAGFIDALESFDPEQAVELKAIARGAGVKPEEVMLVNARTDIIYAAKNPPQMLDDGCTGAIAMPEVTADGHLIHGQNWDWRAACRDSVVIVQRHPVNGPASLNLFEAGTMARCGLTENGLALTANFLRCDHDPGGKGVPSPFARRRVMNAPTLAAAAEKMMQAPRSFSNNIMLSDAQGIGLNLETTPREYYWMKPEGGLLVHANHFISPAARARVFDTGIGVTADSLYRDDRVRDVLAAAKGRITVQTMLDALADRFAWPESVNRPPDGGSGGTGGDGTATVASIVMDVTERTMTVVATPYEQSHATTYRLTSRT